MKSVDRGHAVQFFVHRAHQHLSPKAANGRFGLPFFTQPVEHGDAVQVRALSMLPPQRHKAPRNRKFVGKAEAPQLPKASREVEWSRKPSRRQHRSPAARFDEIKLLVKMDSVYDVQASVEIHDVDAAAQDEMLAVVDHLG